jgi:uncharacterized protein YqgC (DUF456 family)
VAAVLLNVIAIGLILAGLVGAIVPALPGVPLIFAGIWLLAGVDGYRHLGLWWLMCIAGIGAIGMALDLLAAPSELAPAGKPCGARSQAR